MEYKDKKAIDYSLINKDYESFKGAMRSVISNKFRDMLQEAENKVLDTIKNK